MGLCIVVSIMLGFAPDTAETGPQELRTVFMQLVMSLRKDTIGSGTSPHDNRRRLMVAYEYLKRNKSSGKSFY